MKNIYVLLIAGLLVASVTKAAVLADNTDLKSVSLVKASVNTSATAVLAANGYRRYLLIQNQDAALPIYISFSNSAGVTASSTFGVVKLTSGSSFEPRKAPTGAIYLFSTSGSVSTTVISGN